MKAIPSIEIFVEDKSYVAPDLSGDRAVYIPMFSPKGPDNVIVKQNNPPMIIETFGKPNAAKYGLGEYFALKAAQYSSEIYVVRLLPDDAAYANFRVTIDNTDYSSTITATADVIDSTIIPVDSSVVTLVQTGDVIYFNDDPTVSYTVTNVVNDTLNGVYQIEIDSAVTISAGTEIHKLPTQTVDSIAAANTVDEIFGDTGFSTSLFTIYPIGRGVYYNKLQVEFIRNTSVESLMIDQNGNPLYPYMFYDVYVYEIQEDGSRKLIEGPITVSLVPATESGTVFRNIVSGKEYYIETRINEDSNVIRIAVNDNNMKAIFLGNGASDVNAKAARYVFYKSSSVPYEFDNGSDGSLFTTDGYIDWNVASTLLIAAYTGTLNDEVNKITDAELQWYPIDYVVDPGYPTAVKSAMFTLADIREDVLVLLSTENNKQYTQDINYRMEELTFSSYHCMIYSQWRKIFDPYTGKNIEVPATYHAMVNHLSVDETYGITEPVANPNKASLPEAAELVYKPNMTQANELATYQINPTIATRDGIYIPTQWTMYKNLSILQRAHVVKTIHKFKKDIRFLLKDLLQRKATGDNVSEAKRRIDKYLSEWLEGSRDFTKEILKKYELNVEFDDITSTLVVVIKLKFIRAIEQIKVFMTVT